MSRTATTWAGAVLAIGFVVGLAGAAPAADQPPIADAAERGFILGHALTTSDNHATRVAIGYVYELCKAVPDLPSDTASRIGRIVIDGWNEAYGKPTRIGRVELFTQLQDRLALAAGSANERVARDLFLITVAEDGRLADDAKRQSELYRPASEPPLAVPVMLPVRRPSALFEAMRDAATDPRLTAALAPLVQPTVRVRPDASLAEWRQNNPTSTRAFEATGFGPRMNQLANQPKKLPEAIQRAAADAYKRSRAAVQDFAARGPGVPVGHKVGELVPAEIAAREQKARLDALEHDRATYIEGVRLFQALAPDDPTVKKVAAVAATGINAGFAFAAVAAAGASTGGTGLVVVAAVVAAVEFFNAFKSLLGGDGPSDLEQILDAIREVRQAIAVLHADMLEQFRHLRVQLLESTAVVIARLDEMELAARTRNAELRELILQSIMATDLVQGQLTVVREDIYRAVAAGRRDRFHLLEPRKRWREMPFETYRQTLDDLWVMGVKIAADDYGPPADVSPGWGVDTPAYFPALGRAFAKSTDGWDRLNVTRDAAARLGHPLPGGLPPNPKLWALAARDYSALARSWPSLYRRYDHDGGQLRALAAAGRHIREVATAAGEPKLLAAALAAYRAQFARSETSVDAIYLAFAGPDTAMRGYNPFLQASKQSLPAALPIDTLLAHPNYQVESPPIDLRPNVPGFVGGFEWGPHNTPDPMVKLDPGKIALPPAAAAALAARIPVEYRYAAELGLGRLAVEYTAAGVGDEVNVMHNGKKPVNVHPGGEIPPEILKKFASQTTFTHTTRYGRVKLTVRARFIPTQRAEGQASELSYLIFSHTVASPYFSYRWVRNPKATKADRHAMEFRLVSEDGPKATAETLPTRFEELIPELCKQLAADPPDLEKTLAERIRIDAQSISELIARHVDPIRDELVKRIKTEAGANTGGIGRASEAIDGARSLVVHLLCLGHGDWLAVTPAGRELTGAFRELPDGLGVAAAVAADPALYTNPTTRSAAFRLLTARFDDFERRLHVISTTPFKPAATFGRHLIVEGPLGELVALAETIPVSPEAHAPEAPTPEAPETTTANRPLTWWLVWPAILAVLLVGRLVVRRLRARSRSSKKP